MFQIEYRLTLPDKKVVSYPLKFDNQMQQIIEAGGEKFPEWTLLQFKQCGHCPLSPREYPHCPLATRLVNIIKQFDHLMSYQKIFLEVMTDRRTISRETTVQDALSAMMGLVIPTSGCPKTAFFRPMARYHLPLASSDETLYRATSMYLLAQYYRKRNGLTADLEFAGLKRIYQDMQILNAAIARRLRSASRTDSSVNALVLLDMFAVALPMAIEESLEELRYLFRPFMTGQSHSGMR